MADPTPAEIAARIAARYPFSTAEALAMFMELADAVRADERRRVAEEIAAHFEERGDRSTGIPPFRAAQIARQHTTTTGGDRHA